MKKRIPLNLRKKIMFIFLCINSIGIFAQNISVTGLVTDTKNEPLIGVTIQIQGTGKGTVTDIDGKFELENVPGNAQLDVSYIGMLGQIINVNNRTTINIILREDSQQLEEVVVVGYGQQKKVSVTGAIASVSVKELRKTSTTRLDNALAGRVTGLTSMQSSGGQPGVDGATMYLRGAATLNGKSPLILVDGVERDNIRTIDMNEVENVSVLKDASATAVFGVRGANGVILITTRRGEKGEPQLSISFDESWTSFSREPERVHSWDFMKMRNQAKLNSGLSAEFSDEVINKYLNPLEGLDPSSPDYATEKKKRLYMYCDNDYYRKYIAKYTPQSRLNANISGGTDFIDYFVNAGYIYQGGNLNTEPSSKLGYDPSSWMKRLSLRSNFDFKLSKTFTASLNVASYAEQVNMPSASNIYNGDTNWMMTDLIYQALTIKPLSPGPTTISEFGVADGALIDYKYLDRSAFEVINRRGFNRQDKKNLNTQLSFDWDLSNLITPGLSIKAMAAYDTYNSGILGGYKKEISYVTNIDYDKDELTYELYNSNATELSLSSSKSSNYRVNFQGSLNYNRTFDKKHVVTGMVLVQRDYWETAKAEIPYNVIGLSARATYAFDDKYLAEANIGYNGSEQFAPSKRFGFFPAFSLGYIVSNESFLKDNDILTWLKLRGSWGKVGNDQMGDYRFLYQDNITVGGGTSTGGLGGKTISEGLLGNKNITWELAKKLNIGVEIGLLRDFKLSFDYFSEKRSQILISRQTIPAFQGIQSSNIPKVNMGKVDNSGYEVELTYNKVINKDFSINLRGNFGFNKNKIIENDEPKRTEDYVYRYREEGFSIGQCWGYKIDWNSAGKGYFLSQEEIDATPSYSFGTPRVGDFVYVDQNGDGAIDEKDIVPIGYSSVVPGIVYGASIGGTYKNLDFSFLFSGLGRYSKNYSGQGVYETTMEGTYYDWHKNAWTEERWKNGEKITYPALSVAKGTSHTANDFFIQNRSFLRLKNIEIGYTLPESTLKFMGISKLRIYAGGQNLFLWDVLRATHLDPEQDNSYGYPITKNFNIGFNINF
ncbi:MAG: TonB-dependent receptor [Massilibacteroides sp.]|nr:TonB-dependent receptor [Massilibacteroides sp.]MDD3061892.1 TonB-dependent receptor [Massilibacteroides sp.]MDD4660651.1 TonB-dependent receptor [Massilibacteroides sp.]